MRRFIAAAILVLAATLIAGCGEEPAPGKGEDASAPHSDIPPVGKPPVDVPDAVNGRWKAVILVVADKEKGITSEQSVGIGSSAKLAGSDLTVEAVEFLPFFVMQGASITSPTNEPENPAALVTIREGEREIFSGWLFAKFPETHAFTHARYAVTLKEGVPR